MRTESALRQSVPAGGARSDSLEPFERAQRPGAGILGGHAPGEENLKECSILVVDDEPDTLEALVELLGDEGYSVQHAADGVEALDLLRSGWRPSLILLDLRMPVMDGPEFLRQLKLEKDLRQIPVAIVTASAVLERLPARNDAGLFLKPIDYERLLKVVRRYCG